MDSKQCKEFQKSFERLLQEDLEVEDIESFREEYNQVYNCLFLTYYIEHERALQEELRRACEQDKAE